MMAPRRRGAIGSDTIGSVASSLVSWKVIGGIVFGGVVSAFSVGASYTTARHKLEQATPTDRHDSLVKVVAKHDTTIVELKVSEKALRDDVTTTTNALRRDVMGLTCQQAGYPSPFCDSIPRFRNVQQAGTPRRIP